MHHGDVLRSVVVLGRGGSLMAVTVDHGVTSGHVLPRRRDLRRRQQRLGGRRRHRVRGHRRPARRRRHPDGRRGPAGQGDPVHPRPRRPRPGRAGAAGAHRGADPAAPRRPAAVGATHPRPRAVVGRRPRRRRRDRGRRHRRCGCCTRPGTRRGRLLLRRAARLRVHRRHAVPRRSGRDRPLVQRPRHDRRLDPRAAAHAARRDGGAHRPRRRHHDRRRAGPPRARAERAADVSRAAGDG